MKTVLAIALLISTIVLLSSIEFAYCQTTTAMQTTAAATTVNANVMTAVTTRPSSAVRPEGTTAVATLVLLASAFFLHFV